MELINIGRKELITVVDELIDALPVELRTARWIVREQQSFLSKAREEGEEILEQARNESEKLISESYVIREAVIEANALLKKAEIEVQSDRAKIEDEIDSVLTNLENTLGELLGIINKQKEATKSGIYKEELDSKAHQKSMRDKNDSQNQKAYENVNKIFSFGSIFFVLN